MQVNYMKGGATKPNGNGNKIIVHGCNDVSGWGKGFVMAISKKWNSQKKISVPGIKARKILDLAALDLFRLKSMSGWQT